MMTTVRRGRIYDNTSPASLTSVSIQNTVAPILRLPLELLPSIFLYCALDSYYGNLDCDIGVPEWVAVSYVCRCWRFVALGYPTLWSYMFVACPSWTKELLARSRGLPLRVRVHMSPFNDNMRALDFLEQVLPHAERFREFHLYLYTCFAECIVPLLSPRSIPLLSTLEISCSIFPYTSYRMEPKGVDHEVALDDDQGSEAVDPNGSSPLFNEDTPALREFSLEGYPLSWCPPTLGGLTVLRLRGLHWKVRPTIEELTILLGNMPDLVQLHLEDAIRGGFRGYHSASLESSCEWVQLPRLEQFSLSAPFSRIVALLSYMDIPATTRLRFRIRLETYPNKNNFPAFNAFLSQQFQTSFAPIRTLRMNSSGLRVSTFFSASQNECDHPKCCSSLFDDCGCDIPLKIDVEWQPKTEDWKKMLFGICCSVPLASLENLLLECRRLPPALWSNVFWHLPKLRYIAFAGLVLTDVLSLISLPPRPFVQANVHIGGPVDPHTTSQIFAPSLEELYLQGVTIPRARRCGGNPSLHESYLTVLYYALAQRRAAGRPIRRLGINAMVSLMPNALQGMEEVSPGIKMVNDSAKFMEAMKGSSCEDCRPGAGACVKEGNP